MLLCFPIGCLKVWILFGSILTVLIALGMIVVTIIANVQKEKIIQKTDADLTNKVLIGMYLSSIMLLLMGLSGLYGSLKKNRLLLAIFSIGTIIFMIIFVTGMFLFFLGPKTVFNGTCEASQNGFLIDLYNTNKVAHQTLCTDACPCNYNGTDVREGWADPDPNGPVQVQKCPGFMVNISDADVILMETFEKELECGGWCNDGLQDLYYYSDINQPHPSQGCYEALKGFFVRYGDLLGISCSAAFGITLINITMICCFCWHPSRAKNKRNLFRNLMEDEN